MTGGKCDREGREEVENAIGEVDDPLKDGGVGGSQLTCRLLCEDVALCYLFHVAPQVVERGEVRNRHHNKAAHNVQLHDVKASSGGEEVTLTLQQRAIAGGGGIINECIDTICSAKNMNKYLLVNKSRVDDQLDVLLHPQEKSSLQRNDLDVVVDAQPNRGHHAAVHIAQHEAPQHKAHQLTLAMLHHHVHAEKEEEENNAGPDEEFQQDLQRLLELCSVAQRRAQAEQVEDVGREAEGHQGEVDDQESPLLKIHPLTSHVWFSELKKRNKNVLLKRQLCLCGICIFDSTGLCWQQ